MNPLVSVGLSFKSIQANIVKIVKLKDQEKLQKKFDEVRARQQSYKARYQQKTSPKISRESLKDSSQSFMSMLSGMGNLLKVLFALVGIAGIFAILKKSKLGNYVLEFIQSSLTSIIDLIKKSFRFIRDVFSDSRVKLSLFNFIVSFLRFIGTLVVAAASLAISLLRDSEIINTIKTTIVAVFVAILDGIKATYSIISKLVMDNWDTLKQVTYDIFIEIKNALLLALKTAGTIVSGGMDPRITDGLKEIFVEAWRFIVALFTTEFQDPDTGKKFTLLKEGGLWVAEMAGLAAAWMIFGAWMKEKGKALSGMSLLDLKEACSSCMDIPDIDKDKTGKKKPKDIPSKGKTPDKIPQKEKGVIDKVTDYTKETYQKGKEYVGKKITQARNAVGQVVEYVSEKAARIGAKLDAGFKALKTRVKVVAEALYKPLVAMVNSDKIKRLLFTAFEKRFKSAALGRLKVFIVAQIAGLTAASGTAGLGLVINLLSAGLAAYDLYCLYDLLFVSSDGENEDGGFYPVIKTEVEKWWKDQTTPSKASAGPKMPESQPVTQQAPSAPTPVSAPKVKTQQSASGVIDYSAAPKPETSFKQVSAPVAATAATTAAASTAPCQCPPTMDTVTSPQDFPANWTSEAGVVPAGMSMEKRQVGGLGYGGQRKKTDGVIIHHTGGSSIDVAIRTLQNRKLSYHYLVDRNGKVVQILPDNLVGWHAGDTNKKPAFNNYNTISISMVAKDDKDVTPEQVAAAASLEAMLAKKYGFSKTNAFGHGEVASSKQPTEGFTIANAIRSGSVGQKLQNFADQTIEEVKPTISSAAQTVTQKSGEVLDSASGMVRSGLRTLEDMFLSNRPSFTDLSTTVIQNNTISKPGGNMKDKESQSFEFLIARQLN